MRQKGKLSFDTLMTQSLDEVGVLYPLLAEKVSYDPIKPSQLLFI